MTSWNLQLCFVMSGASVNRRCSYTCSAHGPISFSTGAAYHSRMRVVLNHLFLYTVIAIYWNSICSGGRKKEGVRYCNFISHITVYAHNYSKRYWRHNTAVYFPPTHICGDKQQFLFVYTGICMCVGSLWTDIRLYVVLKCVCPHLALHYCAAFLTKPYHCMVGSGGRYQSFAMTIY